MTIRRVRFSDGNNADDGSTWALAKKNVDSNISSWIAAGDEILMSHTNDELRSGFGIDITTNGTYASPVRIICVNDSNESPTTLATTAVIRAQGNIKIYGHCYVYGVQFKAGEGLTGSFSIYISGSQTYEKCLFFLNHVTSTSIIYCQQSASSLVEWIDCDIKLGVSTDYIAVGDTTLHWNGGSVLSPTATPTNGLFKAISPNGGKVLIENVDFSNFSSSLKLVNIANFGPFHFVFRNCRMPSGWTTANLIAGTWTANEYGRVELYNCDAGALNYKMCIEDINGRVEDDITYVRTGGATVDSIPFSRKLTSSTDNGYLRNGLCSPEIYKRIATLGVPITVGIEVLVDSASALTNRDLALDLDYLGTSGYPVGSRVTSFIANRLSYMTTADLPYSPESWYTTGMANPKKHTLLVTFTPNKPGYIIGRVRLRKGSGTIVYVDPKFNVYNQMTEAASASESQAATLVVNAAAAESVTSTDATDWV